jgi:uncharacterized protein DUF1761
MLNFNLNWLAFFIALVVTQVLGFLWYSNVLFAKPWIKAMKKTAKQIQAEANNTVYAYSVIGAAVMLLVLSNVLQWTGAATAVDGALTALIIWAGFVATSSAMNVAFEGRSWTLWLIDNGYHIVNAIISGVILTILK